MLCISITASAQQYWEGHKSYTSDATISSNIVLTGDVTINVNYGVYVTIKGVISGPYSISKSGGGHLTFTNNNTYTGTTTVSDGYLWLDANGSVAGDIHVGYYGRLYFNRSTNTTYSGVISGSGEVWKYGAATSLTLNGVNTFSSTIRTWGKLIVGTNGSIAGAKVRLENTTSELDITAGNKTIEGLDGAANTKVTLGIRTLTINNASNYDYPGVISGTGGIIKSGTGTLTLSGANTYTGPTTVNDGTLTIGFNFNIGNSSSVTLGGSTAKLDISSGSKTIKNLSGVAGSEVILGSRTLTLNITNYMSVYGGKISGTGSIIKTGGSSGLYLEGNNTYTGTTTIQGGTLYVGGGATTGSISNNVSIAQYASLRFYRSNDYTYSGVISGAGDVWQVGTGTVYLTGANTYTGGTTISYGTLSIGDNTSTGSVTGNIVNNSILRFARSDAYTYSGVISGTGDVWQYTLSIGTSASLTLNGANTYSGGTYIRGKLILGASGSIENSYEVNLTDISTSELDISAGNKKIKRLNSTTANRKVTLGTRTLTIGTSGQSDGGGTYAGTTNGTGNIIKTGTETLYFTGSNLYTGTTTISQGTLYIGNNTSYGSVTGNIVNNGTLVFNRSDTYTYSGVISGTGKVIKDGTGDIRFAGDNTYTGGTTINGGILYLGNNTTTGSVTGNIVNNGTLRFNRSNNYTYSGVISGTGIVTNSSQTSSLTLNGANTYSGATYTFGKLILGTSGSIENSSEVQLNPYSTAELDISAGNKKIKGLNGMNVTKVTLGSNTLTIGTNMGYTDGGGTYEGVISGTGGVAKTGTGTLTLSGQNTATGAFTHNSGTVVLSGKWAGAYNMGTTGILTVTGNPTVGSLKLAGSSIKMNLTATPPSKLTVTGAVSVSGNNTLSITTNPITDYVLIEAASGIGSTTPYTVNSTLHTHLSATGTQLILNASTTPLVPAITTATLPDGLVGSPYSATLAATGVTPMTWSLVSGNLPNGLSLSTAGVISGTCSTQGTFNFTVKVTNLAGEDTQALTIKVNITIVAPVITTATLPTGIVGTAYSATLEATGTAPTWTIESGNLPVGLTLNATTGVISGTPTTEGASSFVVKAANSAGSDMKALQIVVSIGAVAPVIVTGTLPNGTVSAAYNTTLVASGTAPITWSIESGNLPDGLTLNAANGAISGTPTTVGTSTFTVIAANSAGADSKELSITILTNEVAPVITTTTLPDGAIGMEYNATLAATGSTPITWTIESGDLPNGLMLNADGVISGTPAAIGTVEFTVKATNNVGSNTKKLTITIAAEATSPVITTTTLPNGAIGTAYNATLTATGTAPITWTIETGNLPNGLTLNTNGIISGTPAAEGAFTFTVKATNGAGSDSKELEITVGSVGIVETQGIASLRVYPNPTRGEIQVTSDELQVTRIEVYDVMGRMVTNVGALRATPLHCGTINIAHLPSGIYFLKITTDSGVVTRKVIKQ